MSLRKPTLDENMAKRQTKNRPTSDSRASVSIANPTVTKSDTNSNFSFDVLIEEIQSLKRTIEKLSAGLDAALAKFTDIDCRCAELEQKLKTHIVAGNDSNIAK